MHNQPHRMHPPPNSKFVLPHQAPANSQVAKDTGCLLTSQMVVLGTLCNLNWTSRTDRPLTMAMFPSKFACAASSSGVHIACCSYATMKNALCSTTVTCRCCVKRVKRRFII